MPTRRLPPPRFASVPCASLAVILAFLTMSVFPLSAQQTPAPAATRTIVFFGDSLSAGYGLANAAEEAFPR